MTTSPALTWQIYDITGLTANYSSQKAMERRLMKRRKGIEVFEEQFKKNKVKKRSRDEGDEEGIGIDEFVDDEEALRGKPRCKMRKILNDE